MDANQIDKVTSQVVQRFPGLAGSHPQVKPYNQGQFLLVYSANARTADGHPITQTVRVVASADGKVLKMTSSR